MEVTDLDDLNRQLDRWVADIADARMHPQGDRRTVREHLEDERTCLVPLPAHRFATDHVGAVRSGKQPYVRFDTNDYSIPHALVRKPLTLVASEHEVRILDGDREVARHRRSYGKRKRVEERAHLDALAAEKRAASELRGRDRLRAATPTSSSSSSRCATRRSPSS